MARDANDTTPISSRRELVAWIEAGVKPAGSPLRIGTEHEKIPFYKANHAPVPYEPGGVRALIEGLQAAQGWTPIFDRDALIGLYDPEGGGAISLEPGGQFELSGAPLGDVHATRAERDAHFAALERIAAPLGIGFLDLGASPKWSRAQTPVMPKQRYGIMSAYMPKVGSLGLDMMFRTATIQVNLDFTSESDMVRKMRVGLALQPIVTALFANSPFLDGKPTGALSQRSNIWRDTDPDRTGMLPFAFEDGMGFERYVDYALDAPMYFVKRGEIYHDVAGASFHDLLAGKLPQLPGERATIADWANHLSTIFPEVRLKTYLEMRGADAGPRAHITALPALFAGLFYDGAALDGAGELIRGWSAIERQNLRDEVPFKGAGGFDPWPLRARNRAGYAGSRPRGADAARATGLRRRGRDDLSGAAGGHRAKRPDARGATARGVSRPLAGIGRAGFRGMRALGRASRFAELENASP